MRQMLHSLVAGGLLFLGVPVLAAPAAPGSWVNGVIPIQRPAEADVSMLPIAQPRPTSEQEGWAQETPGQRIAYNVVEPQLVRIESRLPEDKSAPAVILVPGGGFQFLAMDNEGYDVARRLGAQGVRVFILKYRTLPIPGGFAGFKDAITRLFLKGERPVGDDVPYAVADTQTAIRMVRANAASWHIDPARIGIVGFSAGAITVLATVQANDSAARADFVGMIYGPTQAGPVPAKAPPLFAALAADDRFFRAQDLGLIHAWRLSGSPVELHLYSGGGHGFASYPTGTTSDAWFDQFALWLRLSGFTGAR